MAIAILVGRDQEEKNQLLWFIDEWKQSLLALEPDLDIRVWPELGNVSDIQLALVWKHPLGMLTRFSNLKGISSLGAGVDHFFADTEWPKDVPLVRIVDPYMANDIVQYVVAYVLNYIKRVDHWADKQRHKEWYKQPPFNFADLAIGIMGLGFLGGKAARALAGLGLNVIGWSRSQKMIDGIETYAGDAEFHAFLSQSHLIVCMLPLTNETQHILNQTTFSYLPEGAYVMNLGRGDHLVEDDLLDALDSGHLSGACLDVFKQEPLPKDHPFWTHPSIRVTPHIASVTNAATAAPQVLENYRRLLAGMPLLNVVDTAKGY